MKKPARDIDLRSARVIVACGAGVKTAEDFSFVKDLADCLGAKIAGTRPAVDRGFIAREQMIGQTGVSVRPEVYIAIGISGSAQHRSGLDESATIIAVNRDRRAPIVSLADHAIIGDLREVIPPMIEACRGGATIEQLIRSSAQGQSDGKLLHRQ